MGFPTSYSSLSLDSNLQQNNIRRKSDEPCTLFSGEQFVLLQSWHIFAVRMNRSSFQPCVSFIKSTSWGRTREKTIIREGRILIRMRSQIK
ncbi:hypothetical protein LINPERPRIM_LOCUS36265 [Linum perenne]